MNELRGETAMTTQIRNDQNNITKESVYKALLREERSSKDTLKEERLFSFFFPLFSLRRVFKTTVMPFFIYCFFFSFGYYPFLLSFFSVLYLCLPSGLFIFPFPAGLI